MSFLSDIFSKKKEVNEQPITLTREDLENKLVVDYQQEYVAGYRSFVRCQRRDANEEEAKELKQVFDLISSVPEGKKLIDEVAKAGFQFSLQAFSGNNDGCMYGQRKLIMLCPVNHNSIASLATTAFHEMVHAVQDTRTNQLLSNSSKLNIADQFKFQRACEAAAWTEEARFAYQISKDHPEVLKHVSQFPMYQAFDEEMKKSNDMDKAGNAAFKAWYNYPHYQQAYEKDHIANITFGLKNAENAYNRKCLRESISNEQVMDSIFLTDSLKKAVEPEYLTSPEALSITPAGLDRIKKAESKYTSIFFFKDNDKSYMSMYSTENKKRFDDVENDPSAMLCASHNSLQSKLNATASSKQETKKNLVQKALINNMGR
ncbi:MAG: hypothetical protein MJ247_01725 [Alphaproteobacteria bacterium]|nr:hypothetical protein [Alphaproteobacteria bacterium]